MVESVNNGLTLEHSCGANPLATLVRLCTGPWCVRPLDGLRNASHTVLPQPRPPSPNQHTESLAPSWVLPTGALVRISSVAARQSRLPAASGPRSAIRRRHARPQRGLARKKPCHQSVFWPCNPHSSGRSCGLFAVGHHCHGMRFVPPSSQRDVFQ